MTEPHPCSDRAAQPSPPTIDRVPVVLVHSGLYDDMTPDECWVASGVIAALDRRIITYRMPQRPARPADWVEESNALAAQIDAHGWTGVVVVAASDGCSAAVRLAVDHPSLVARLVLAWPTTAGDRVADSLLATMIEELAGREPVADLLVGPTADHGTTLRGVTDIELASLSMPVMVWPTVPENQFHQGRTTTALLTALAQPILLAGSPEPTNPAFADFCDAFVSMLIEVSIVDEEDRRAEAG